MTGTTSSPRSTGAKRRRPLLLTVVAAGAVVGLLGVAGVFATSSDRATTGQNDARSGDLRVPAPEVSLELAHATGTAFNGPVTCGSDWSPDLTTGVLTSDGVALDAAAAQPTDLGYVCIRNVGTAPATYSAQALDLVDSELSCAPGEAAVDASCGSGPGELSSSLNVWFQTINQRSSFGCLHQTDVWSLQAMATTRVTEIGQLDPGETQKVCLKATWDVGASSQTDRASWRFAFDATEHTCVNDLQEPNDDYGSAFVLPGFPTVSGMICRGDEDFYRVTTGPQPLVAEISGFAESGTNHLHLVLRSIPSGAVVAAQVNGSTEQVTIPANGTYLVQVTSPFAVTETPYVLGFHGVP